MGNLYPARGSDRDCVVFVKQAHFSYSESPRTPPIEWTSLHWRTYSVDLEPVYDLHPITNSPCQRLWHRHNVSSFFFLFSHFCIYLFFLHFFFFFFLLHFFIFCSFFRFFFLFQQVIFLTVNHRGPLPLRELHSTGETIVWRDPGGSWACLWPVSNYEWINSPSQRLWHRYNVSSFFLFFFLSFFLLFFSRSFFLWWITTDPFEGTFFGGSWAFFFQQVVFLMVNHHGPLPLRELHSTDETIVWRDPGGSWACLRPVYNYEWINSPSQRLWHRYNVSSFFLSFFFLFFFFFSAGRFSYGESPRTPPLEGTSLHRRNNSVERPWGILSLFMTCFQLRVN